MKFTTVKYDELNPRQQENYNFHKVAAILADYGFNSLRLTDDWQGADFIAVHIDGKRFLKIQLKSGITIAKKYNDKEIHIAFMEDDVLYLYPHDVVRDKLFADGLIEHTKSWREDGLYLWSQMPKNKKAMMEQYALTPAKK